MTVRRRAYCVAFTPSEYRTLHGARGGRDARQTVWLAVTAYPELPIARQEKQSAKLFLDLPEHLHAKVQRIALRRNASCSSVIRAAVRRFLEEAEQCG